MVWVNLRWPRAFIILYSGEEIEKWMNQYSAVSTTTQSAFDLNRRDWKEEIQGKWGNSGEHWKDYSNLDGTQEKFITPTHHPLTVNTSLVFPFINQLTTTLWGICFSKNPRESDWSWKARRHNAKLKYGGKRKTKTISYLEPAGRTTEAGLEEKNHTKINGWYHHLPFHSKRWHKSFILKICIVSLFKISFEL